MGELIAVCPLSSDCANELPWVIWEKAISVAELPRNNTDCRYVSSSDATTLINTMRQMAPSLPAINRNQYLSVVQRMQKAGGNAGAFSAWN